MDLKINNTIRRSTKVKCVLRKCPLFKFCISCLKARFMGIIIVNNSGIINALGAMLLHPQSSICPARSRSNLNDKWPGNQAELNLFKGTWDQECYLRDKTF